MMRSRDEGGAGRSRLDAAQETTLRRLSTWPYPLRRLALRLIFGTLIRMPFLQPDPQIVHVCGKALSLPRSASRWLVKRSLVHDALFQLEWLALANRSTAGLLADARYIRSDADEELAWISSQSGAVIATLHFGPYSLGLAWLLNRYFRGRKVIVIKSRTDNRDETRAMARLATLGVEIELVAPDSQDFHRVLKTIRKGAIAVVMADLPDSYGKSARIELVSHEAYLANGLVDLAALCEVPIMLFRVRSSGRRDIVEVDAIFDVVRGDEASRSRAAAHVGQFVSRTIRDFPEQWHMWPRFPEYVKAAEKAC